MRRIHVGQTNIHNNKDQCLLFTIINFRDLGDTLDEAIELIFAPHNIHFLCRDSYYQSLQLQAVVRSFTPDASVTSVDSFTMVRLDYFFSSGVTRGAEGRSPPGAAPEGRKIVLNIKELSNYG